MPNLHLSRRIQHALTGLVLLLVSYIIPSYPLGFILLSFATLAFYYIHHKRLYDVEWDDWYIEKFGELLREHERGEWEKDDDTTTKKKDVTNDGIISSNKAKKKRMRRRKTSPALPGAFYFLLGTTLSTLFFSSIVARTSLLVLSLADPMAGIVGVWFTQLGYNVRWEQLLEKIKRKSSKSANNEPIGERGGPSIAGSLACCITTILCICVYIPTNNHSTISDSAVDGGDGSVSLSFNAKLCIGVVTAMTEGMAGKHLLPRLMTDDNLLIPLVVGSLIFRLNAENR